MAKAAEKADKKLEITHAPARIEIEKVESRLAEQLKSRPNLMSQVVDVVAESLGAVKKQWDLKAGVMLEEPDHRIRLDAAKFIAAYTEGLPAQTVLNMNVDAGNRPALRDALTKSPQARKAIAAILARDDSVGAGASG